MSGLHVALIGLAGIVIGGVLSGFVTYFVTNKQAEKIDTQRAKGDARLLASDLEVTEDRFYSSLLDCRYRLYKVRLSLPQAERLLLARTLESDEWAKVANAMGAIQIQIERGVEEHEFVQADVKQIRAVIRAIDAARRALQPISDLKPSTRAELQSELTEGARC